MDKLSWQSPWVNTKTEVTDAESAGMAARPRTSAETGLGMVEMDEGSAPASQSRLSRAFQESCKLLVISKGIMDVIVSCFPVFSTLLPSLLLIIFW